MLFVVGVVLIDITLVLTFLNGTKSWEFQTEQSQTYKLIKNRDNTLAPDVGITTEEKH